MNTVDNLRRLRRMPNKPKTPISGFRIPQELKDAAAKKATEEGRTLTDVVLEALRRYVDTEL